MDTKRIGRRIKAFRKLKGFTQIDLAKEMDVPIAQLGAVERGTEQAADGLIAMIAQTLDVPKKEIMHSAKETDGYNNEKSDLKEGTSRFK